MENDALIGENECETCFSEMDGLDRFQHKCGAKNHKSCLQAWMRRRNINPTELSRCQRCFSRYHRGEINRIFKYYDPSRSNEPGQERFYDDFIMNSLIMQNMNDPVYVHNSNVVQNLFTDSAGHFQRVDNAYMKFELVMKFLYNFMNYLRMGKEAYLVPRPEERTYAAWQQYQTIKNTVNPVPVLAIKNGSDVVYVTADQWKRPLKSFVPEGAKPFYLDSVDETIKATDNKYTTITVEELLSNMAETMIERALENPAANESVFKEFINDLPITISYGSMKGGKRRRKTRKNKGVRGGGYKIHPYTSKSESPDYDNIVVRTPVRQPTHKGFININKELLSLGKPRLEFTSPRGRRTMKKHEKIDLYSEMQKLKEHIDNKNKGSK